MKQGRPKNTHARTRARRHTLEIHRRTETHTPTGEERDHGALSSEAFGDCRTDAAARSRYHDHLAVKLAHLCCPRARQVQARTQAGGQATRTRKHAARNGRGFLLPVAALPCIHAHPAAKQLQRRARQDRANTRPPPAPCPHAAPRAAPHKHEPPPGRGVSAPPVIRRGAPAAQRKPPPRAANLARPRRQSRAGAACGPPRKQAADAARDHTTAARSIFFCACRVRAHDEHVPMPRATKGRPPSLPTHHTAVDRGHRKKNGVKNLLYYGAPTGTS